MMNSMFPVWTLSSLILSYTLAFPIFNNQSTGSDININVAEGMEHKTRLMENNATQTNFTGFNRTSPIIGVIKWTSGCFAPTCHMANLVDRMQNGDEEAGKSTWDPFGPGKK